MNVDTGDQEQLTLTREDTERLRRIVERYGAHFRRDDDYYDALALLSSDEKEEQ